MSDYISRRDYADTFGPTVGDRVRLADTELFIEVEQDFTSYGGTYYGDEVMFGGGKVIRDGMGQAPISRADGAVDVVIINALILDWWGVVKADVGLKDGNIVKIGKAGNPHTQDQIDIIIGPSTEVIAGEGKILTAGAIDTHVHFLSPEQIPVAIASGITTMLGGGTGPATGTVATTCTPGAWNIHRMLEAAEAFPMNLGFMGKGSSSHPAALVEQINAGAMGLKIHEDWSAAAAVIDTSLTVADEYDVQVALHADSLNEAGFVENTVNAFKDRVIHSFHTEGAGGGHAPDIMTICALNNVLPASTNPTRPYTINTFDEHKDMLMVCHHLNKNIPEDVKFAESRIRRETIAAEDLLHDMGAFSIMSSDSQAMGRIGEVVTRTWQTAHKMKVQKGLLPDPENESETHDNYRAKRYVAKYTINPAIAHGISHCVGSVEEGKLADLVLWNPAFFGVKPELVVKGGMVAYAHVGDSNASISTPEPVHMRPMFGSFGKAINSIAYTFVSQAAMDLDIASQLGIAAKRLRPVFNTRQISKRDLKLNNLTPNIEVVPETFEVRVDGKLLTCEPAEVLPMAQRYFLF